MLPPRFLLARSIKSAPNGLRKKSSRPTRPSPRDSHPSRSKRPSPSLKKKSLSSTRRNPNRNPSWKSSRNQNRWLQKKSSPKPHLHRSLKFPSLRKSQFPRTRPNQLRRLFHRGRRWVKKLVSLIWPRAPVRRVRVNAARRRRARKLPVAVRVSRCKVVAPANRRNVVMGADNFSNADAMVVRCNKARRRHVPPRRKRQN